MCVRVCWCVGVCLVLNDAWWALRLTPLLRALGCCLLSGSGSPPRLTHVAGGALASSLLGAAGWVGSVPTKASLWTGRAQVGSSLVSSVAPPAESWAGTSQESHVNPHPEAEHSHP